MRTLEAFNRFKPSRAQLIGGSLILSAGMLALAAVPNTFTSGTTISAAQMNANFTDADTRITALESQIANTVACPANAPTRFTDKGDGTICDRQTGLMWEKKTGTVGARVTCNEQLPCSDPHNVNNSYSWGTQPSEQTGTLYTQFLPQLNDTLTPNDGLTTSCFAGHCDWRVPNVGELRSILQASNPGCTVNPCVAPGFPGPTRPEFYWAPAPWSGAPTNGWAVSFSDGLVLSGAGSFGDGGHARAVRGGR